MRIILLDNYDSFTYNLLHYPRRAGRGGGRDATMPSPPKSRWRIKPDGIVISPGPCTPQQAGICLDLIKQASRQNPDSRRLPRPSGHRRGVRRQGGPRARADARQGQRHPPRQAAAVFAGLPSPSTPRATIR